MARIKNMGTATMRFGEGVIISGSAGSDLYALAVTGSSRTSDNIIVDGRIGIGTDSPGYKLEVGGNMAVGEYIYHRNDTDTFVQLQDDNISIETGGAERIRMDNNGVFIPDSPANASLFVSGGIEVTPGNQEGLRFMKSANELNFISFQDGTDGGSYNARLSYNSTEYLFIAPGRGGDFFINSGKNVGDFTYPFSIMDDGTAKFTKGLESATDRATDLDSSIAFYVSGTIDGNNNAVFDANVVMNGTTLQGAAQRVSTTVASSFPYTVAEEDYVILVEGTGTPRAINLPPKADHAGRVLIIKDATGNASSNNIQINPDGSENIDGLGDKLINGNKSSLTIICGSDQWYVLGNYPG